MKFITSEALNFIPSGRLEQDSSRHELHKFRTSELHTFSTSDLPKFPTSYLMNFIAAYVEILAGLSELCTGRLSGLKYCRFAKPRRRPAEEQQEEQPEARLKKNDDNIETTLAR